MRTFDYGHLPKGLFGGKVGDANMKVFEDKGKLDLYEQMHPELLAPFEEAARTDNADASARIEGLYIDKSRVSALMAGDEPIGETEAQIAGYAKALGVIDSELADLDLSTATIVKLFETMYGYRNLGRKSRYRKKDYIYVQVDGHAQAKIKRPYPMHAQRAHIQYETECGKKYLPSGNVCTKEQRATKRFKKVQKGY